MVEERITETREQDGAVHTHTTIIRDEPAEPRRGVAGWLALGLLLMVAVAGLIIFNQMGDAEVAKDAAISEAAEDVGNAANQVGDAVEEGIQQVTE